MVRGMFAVSADRSKGGNLAAKESHYDVVKDPTVVTCAFPGQCRGSRDIQEEK
jgi:hypothetical protein